MHQFTSAAGSCPDYRSQEAISYDGRQAMLQQRSTCQPYQLGAIAQGDLHDNSAPGAPCEPCYNCGSFDHWAQNCPEPRREVPAGAMTNQRPFKRQRTSAPLVTKYPVPPTSSHGFPYYQPLHAPGRGFTHPPARQNYQQYARQPTQTPPHSHLPRPWQQQKALPSLMSTHHIHQWTSQNLCISNAEDYSYLSNPNTSIFRGTQKKAPSPQNDRCQTPLALPSSGQGIVERLLESPNRKRSVDEQALTSSQQGKSNPVPHLEALKDGALDESADESWWEEMRALDFPEESCGSKNIVSYPANPVAEPLPSTMTDQDHVVRLPIARSIPAGTPVSKYFRNLNDGDYCRNSITEKMVIEDNDPALVMFTDESETISKDKLLFGRGKLDLMAKDVSCGDEGFNNNCIKESVTSDNAQEFGDILGLGSDALPTPCQSQESEEERQAREQEEKLAALGVTGFAKPVHTSVRRSKMPAMSTSSEEQETLVARDFPADHHAQCVFLQTSEKVIGDAHGNNAPIEQRPDSHTNADWEGYIGRASPLGSYHRQGSLQTPPTSASHDTRSDNSENCAQRLSSGGDQSIIMNSPVGSIGVGLDRYRSPLNDHSHQDLSSKWSVTKFSPEVDEGPKRQKDESRPKEKRKAPKIAAAYSRRW